MIQWLILIAGVGREHHEKMKRICNEQLEILSKVDPGYPSWKGDILKHLSTATLNLARLVRVFSFFFIISSGPFKGFSYIFLQDLQDGIITRPEFLILVRDSMKWVQEGHRCKSCVKIDKSSAMTLDEIVDSMSESETSLASRCSSIHGSFADLS